MEAGLHAIVQGRVQGVFFRAFIRSQARALGLSGQVRNLPSGFEVEVYVEGEREKLEELLKHLEKGPPGARVQNVAVTWGPAQGEYRGFEVRS